MKLFGKGAGDMFARHNIFSYFQILDLDIYFIISNIDSLIKC